MAGGEDVAESGVKVAGVPRVRDIAILACPMHHEGQLGRRTKQTFDGADVGAVGTNDEVVPIERSAVYPARTMAVERDAVSAERLFCRRIDVIADLFGRDRHGGNPKTIFESGLAAQVTEDKLCHRRTADIAMTYKEDGGHA